MDKLVREKKVLIKKSIFCSVGNKLVNANRYENGNYYISSGDYIEGVPLERSIKIKR